MKRRRGLAVAVGLRCLGPRCLGRRCLGAALLGAALNRMSHETPGTFGEAPKPW